MASRFLQCSPGHRRTQLQYLTDLILVYIIKPVQNYSTSFHQALLKTAEMAYFLHEITFKSIITKNNQPW